MNKFHIKFLSLPQTPTLKGSKNEMSTVKTVAEFPMNLHFQSSTFERHKPKGYAYMDDILKFSDCPRGSTISFDVLHVID
jgi:hypothetical protein